MKSVLVTGAALAMLLLPAVGHAQRAIDIHADNAGDLAKLCTAKPGGRGDAELNYCSGFAQGAVDVLLHFQPKAFCFPKPAPTRRATLTQFAEWVNSVPDHAKMGAAPGLAAFLAERFPCK